MEHIYGGLVPLMAILCTFGIPTLVIVILAMFRHRQNMELIRHGINPGATLPAYPVGKSLFWGILLVGLGLALIVAKLVNGDHHDLSAGIIFLGSGIAFLAYWKITTPNRDRDRGIYEERLGIGHDVDHTTGSAPRERENMEKIIDE